MRIGVVLDINGEDAIVMRNGGDFITVKAKDNWKTGDTVLFNEKKRNHKPLYMIAACFALFIIMGILWYCYN